MQQDSSSLTSLSWRRPDARRVGVLLAVVLGASMATGAGPVRAAPLPALTIAGPRAVALGGRIVLEAQGIAPGAACHWSIEPVRAAASGRVRLVNPSVRVYPNGGELTVHGEAISPSARDVLVRLSCVGPSGEQRASARLTCVDAELTTYRPQHGAGYFPFSKTPVSELDEEDPAHGPGIRRADVDDFDPAGEDDLVELLVQVQPADAPFVLVRDDASLSVWRTRDRAPGTEVPFVGDVSEPLAVSGGAVGSATLWVEWSGASHGSSGLRVRAQAGVGRIDAVRFHSFRSIVVALGGEDQAPSLPVSSNHGTFVVGTALYRLGYDVHLYDEDDVSATGTGPTYAEAATAIRERSVEHVIAFGYSHGGGSTYDLAERLDANRAGLGTFTIPFTSYIDGIENDSDFDVEQENRFPPGSSYHANQYQRGSLEDFFLDGGPVPNSDPPPSGLDVETTPWGVGATHFVVDDFGEVRDFIQANLDQRVTP